MEGARRPRLVVYSHVYPNAAQPTFGLFVRERMRRVAEHLDLVVVAPVPWFPGQGLARRWRPHLRPPVPRVERQDGIEVHHPRFFSIPGLFKGADAFFEALGTLALLLRLRRAGRCDLIDAHFIWPDGVAAAWLARLLGCPYSITLRGSLMRFRGRVLHRIQIRRALAGAARIFTVAASLRAEALAWGEAPERVQVVANGVDLDRFYPEPRALCRARWGLSPEARVLVSVGGLSERKGFQHLIAALPALLASEPELHLLIAGGATPEGNTAEALRALAIRLGVADRVHLLGAVAPDALRFVYSAGDVFALATRFEGWANVLLEAMACGLPVVTTEVGGNAEVVCDARLGMLLPYAEGRGDGETLRLALVEALRAALARDWDRHFIRDHARANAWQTRIPALVAALASLDRAAGREEGAPCAP